MTRTTPAGFAGILAFMGLLAGCAAPREPQAAPSRQDVIVYHQPERFCGWPANNGMWSWEDEILVGFTLAHYKEYPDRHSYDRDKPRETVMARSQDGGRTWRLERPESLADNSGEEPVACPGGIRFDHPDFAMRCRNDSLQVSYDRGRTWGTPYLLPDFGQIDIMPRTDYLVSDPESSLLFLTATKQNGREGRPFVAEAMGGGKTIRFVSWIGPEPEGFSIMPSTVQISPEHLLSAIRRYDRESIEEGWIEVHRSEDDGESWTWLSKVADNGAHAGNPPSMIRLRDGRIVVTYGRRSPPYGIRARISRDQGKTWEPELVLRDDARSWDIGYTQSVQRPDGQVVTVYYYSTEEHREQHIAGTIWDPGEAGG